MSDKLEAAIRNGNHAAMLIEDPVLNDALNRIEKASIDVMLEASAERLLEARANVRAVENLRVALREYVNAGKIAKVTLTPSN